MSPLNSYHYYHKWLFQKCLATEFKSMFKVSPLPANFDVKSHFEMLFVPHQFINQIQGKKDWLDIACKKSFWMGIKKKYIYFFQFFYSRLLLVAYNLQQDKTLCQWIEWILMPNWRVVFRYKSLKNHREWFADMGSLVYN